MTLLTRNFETLKRQVAAHVDADAVVRGHYWKLSDNAVGGTGCFMGCLVHGDDPTEIEEQFGIPQAVTRIAEGIFEYLAGDVELFSRLPEAIATDGKDLTRVTWQFLAAELREMPQQEGEIQSAVDAVIEGMDLLASGKPWPDAARAAAYAARAADAAARAARATAGALVRQRETLLRLISEAPVVQGEIK